MRRLQRYWSIALVGQEGLADVRKLIGRASQTITPVLVSVHAYENEGVNAIPVALARLLGQRLELECESRVVQSNVVSHTGADGFGRLARQAAFTGGIQPGHDYVMVGSSAPGCVEP